jgi:hypothetical protein
LTGKSASEGNTESLFFPFAFSVLSLCFQRPLQEKELNPAASCMNTLKIFWEGENGNCYLLSESSGDLFHTNLTLANCALKNVMYFLQETFVYFKNTM